MATNSTNIAKGQSGSVLQCVAVCYRVLQMRCSVLEWVAVCYSVLQRVAVCCSVLQLCCSLLQCVAVCCRARKKSRKTRVKKICVAVFCSVLQCVAVCGSVLQCVPVCCNGLQCVASITLCCSDLATSSREKGQSGGKPSYKILNSFRDVLL